ncbi:MAG: histidinol dehydrogenase [Melioribacteraceae bacterium]|nr:histidinol dehydrogenase [Melioribacteraceae bacterium]
MKLFNLNDLSKDELKKLFLRQAIDNIKVSGIVNPILNDIKLGGLDSVIKYAKKFDALETDDILVSKIEIDNSLKSISKSSKNALELAYQNIYKFHEKEIPKSFSIETMPGVKCSREFRAIENVGLYIPGGTAVLPSTVLMLGIPAKIAGCKRVVLCSPVGKVISNEVLYAANLCGISEIYKVGGAQAVGLMSYGTAKIEKVDKIFGPGNQYVTCAKSIISIDPDGCAIDMPAGPSEVLVIADETANARFIASDLLSQAEHGVDSQVILLTTSDVLAANVSKEVEEQSDKLERNSFITESLKSSFILKVNSLDDAFELSNKYAPEHLILNINNAESYSEKVINAGSVFVGEFSPESVGDYASGTNHSLPTYGYAKSYSGVSVDSFMKAITFQKLSKDGLKNIADTVITLAEVEKLDAHANAVKVRLENEN